MAFRLVNPLPQFFTVDGKVLAGGNLYFTDSGTSNPRPTYADPALSAENTNPVILDASGRPNADIWMDGVYRVVLKDASGATIWTKDNVEGPADLPGMAGNEDYFLGTDGESLIWRPVLQVPSVAGQSGKVLINDGEAPYWDNPASSGIPALVADKFLTNNGTSMSWVDIGGSSSSSSGFVVGGIRVQFGVGTAPASGSHTTNTNINFPVSFSAIPYVAVSRGGAMTASGFNGVYGQQSASVSGFNACFDINVDSSNSAFNITSDVPFSWLAVGLA